MHGKTQTIPYYVIKTDIFYLSLVSIFSIFLISHKYPPFFLFENAPQMSRLPLDIPEENSGPLAVVF